MSPSSLIFVAVVAIWATYLVVHVARRREYLATARTVDRFSSQMRVLERRAATYTAPRTQGRVSSASLSRSRPLAASSVPGVFGATVSQVQMHSADAAAAGAERAAAVPVPARALAARPRAEGPTGTGTGTGTGTATTTATGTAGPDAQEAAPRHRVRRAVLAASLAVAVVTGVLAALALLSWYVPVAAVGVVALTIVGLRRAVVADRRARRRRLAAARREQVNAARLAREAALEARPSAPAFPVAQEHVVAGPAEFVVARTGAGHIDADVADDAPTGSFAVAATRVMPKVAESIDPLHGDPAWDPTPVPPPTYTLKARAERPLPPPIDVPVPIEVEADDVYWSDEHRRPHAVNG